MTATSHKNRPLILQLIGPLRIPALLVLMLALWPLMLFLWVAFLAIGSLWLVIRKPKPKDTGMGGGYPVTRSSAGFGGFNEYRAYEIALRARRERARQEQRWVADAQAEAEAQAQIDAWIGGGGERSPAAQDRGQR
ncbi:MAG: hypothetical protein ACK5GZ_05970 [Cyanobium sp.]|jgi:hypothetical protein